MKTHIEILTMFNYDAVTGALSWAKNFGQRAKAGNEAGWIDASTGYRSIRIDGRNFKVHRLIWFFVNGDWPKGHIDHIDGNRLNNKMDNLRVVSCSENNQNQRRARSDNTTNFLGVSKHKNTNLYRARIGLKGKSKYLGLFGAPEDAHNAYVLAKRQLHKNICSI